MSWGAIAVGVGSLAASLIGSKGAKDAAKEQTKGGDAAIAEQRRQYDQTRADFAPARETGSQALAAIASGLGLPGYSSPGTAKPLSFEEWSAQNPQTAASGGTGSRVGSTGIAINPITGQVDFGAKALSPSINLNPLNPVSALTGGLPIPKAASDTLNRIADPLGLFHKKKKKPKPVAATAAEAVVGSSPKTDPRAAYDAYVAGFKPEGPAPGSDAVTQGDFNRDFTIADFEANKDPGYQFRMDEGSRARQGSNAATVGVQNGRTLRELERYGQDYASGEYSNAYNRFNNDRTTRFNRLATIAGVGQTATGSTANAGQNASNNVAEAMIGQANARAGGRVGQANAVNGGIQTLGNYYLQSRYGSAPKTPPYITPPIYQDNTGGSWTG
jgi:hypothetical protein